LLFPRHTAVVEILEDVQPERSVIDACEEIARNGYDIVLDDFIFKSDLAPFVALAKIIKIDFRQMSIESIGRNVRRLSNYNIKLLAEKIETRDELKVALEMGFEYFQGNFFSEPEIITGRRLATCRVSLLEVKRRLDEDDVDVDELGKLITRDVIISYNLLCFINSAYSRGVERITSVEQAIIFLGPEKIKRFVYLMYVERVKPVLDASAAA
jgi:EAL and modified HD-GYP domain-containing signal transduction protein